MGVLPLLFKDGLTHKSLGLDGSEVFDITGMEGGITPGMDVDCRINRADSLRENIQLMCRIDTSDEVDYSLHGGSLQYVLRRMIAEAA